MTTWWLKFKLLSDTTLGRGDGLAGVVDVEVQHDEYGLPYLSGKTLKGLLGAECAEILFALQLAAPTSAHTWQLAAHRLFGDPGSSLDSGGLMRVGDAQLPRSLRQAVAADFAANLPEKHGLMQRGILESLTAVRRQTAMDAASGAPLDNTLRTMRVILRETPFEAELTFAGQVNDQERGLLAACTRALRRVGTGRGRGRGKVGAELYEAYPGDGVSPVTGQWFAMFRQAVQA